MSKIDEIGSKLPLYYITSIRFLNLRFRKLYYTTYGIITLFKQTLCRICGLVSQSFIYIIAMSIVNATSPDYSLPPIYLYPV